ncbi:unnamed protein product [Aspergillus oryzae RIB40]|uniref:DNA, SC012 n=1 Tax=Aspergillus oryzae (strain ATCC 42149 / RIB 40) TaxID=510516 RepID=Q2UCZ5_ASPOR|nr:unnamed protein product [Aspergillus oryzae RIB40]BAE60570.1 unnamed protein product [Aspergillus oryzae RIB40]
MGLLVVIYPATSTAASQASKQPGSHQVYYYCAAYFPSPPLLSLFPLCNPTSCLDLLTYHSINSSKMAKSKAVTSKLAVQERLPDLNVLKCLFIEDAVSSV